MTIHKPSLRVIDDAIKTVQDGEQKLSIFRRHSKYSCLALEGAAYIIHGSHVYGKPNPADIYKEQYKAYVKAANGGRLPKWWNNLNYARHHRVTALKGFRQACIDAAKKQKKAK